MLDYQNQEFKTLDQLRKTVPSIFTRTGASTTSDKYSHIPTDKVKISESGISSHNAIKTLQDVGFDGFLMGEHFMLHEYPGEAAEHFIKTFAQ